MAAPIVIIAALLLYDVGIVLACLLFALPLPLKILGAALALLQAGIGVYVLVKRIKEIRSGEEDDLSQY